MLVLSRKKNESIVIDDNIVITVVEVRGDKVRLGIEAPKETPVHRQEVYDAIQKNSPAPTPTETPTESQISDAKSPIDGEFGLKYQIFILRKMLEELPTELNKLLIGQLGEIAKSLSNRDKLIKIAVFRELEEIGRAHV